LFCYLTRSEQIRFDWASSRPTRLWTASFDGGSFSFRLGPFGIDLWTVCDILFYKRSDIAMFKLHPLFVNNSLSNIISIL
jgi:hypothetical protein